MTVTLRQRIEKSIARRTIADLLKAGYTLGVNDGGETTLRACDKPATVLAAMFTTDEDYLLVYRPGEKKHFGWVFFIYGNDGPDVINDYSTNLESVLGPINDWTDTRYG